MENKKIVPGNFDLESYLMVLIKRKWVFLCVFALFLGGSIIVSLLCPKIYRATAVLEIGSLHGSFVENPSQVANAVNAGVYGNYSGLEAEAIKDTGFLRISVESKNIEETKTILEKVSGAIVSAHKEKLEEKRERFITENELLEQRIRVLRAYVREFFDRIELFKYEDKLSQRKQGLETLKETKVLKAPKPDLSPANSSLSSNIGVGIFLGLLFGLFSAFAVEAWKRNRD